MKNSAPPAPRPSGLHHSSALGYFVLFVGLIGLGLTGLLDYWHAHHPRTQRNYHVTRGWVEHTRQAEPKQPGETLVLVLGNSQAYGEEIEDWETWCHRLGPLLEPNLGPVRVLNWSVRGGSGPDFVVLGAAAARLNPDVTILMTSPENFDVTHVDAARNRATFLPWASDAHWLVTFPKVGNHLPDRFVRRYFHRADRPSLFLGRHFELWRSRYVPFGRLTHHHAFRYFQPGWVKRRGKRERPPRTVSPELVEDFFYATESISGRRVVAMMPLHTERRGETLTARAELLSRAEVAGRETWDLSPELDDGRFVTSTHLDVSGHATLAEIVAERLRP